MSFFEVEFPRTISYKATGGSMFSTTVNEGLSGFEQRNKNWAQSRGQWQVSLITPTAFAGDGQTFADLLNSFFLVCGGMGDGFRLFDWLDHQATGQIIGVGDGSTLTFQLTKTYTIGGRSYVRVISKPITGTVNNYKGVALANTVTVYVNGVPSAFASVSSTTGVVTFAGGHAPTAGQIISWDGQFHFPVRFDADGITLQTDESNVQAGNPIVSWASVGLKEVRIAAGQSQG